MKLALVSVFFLGYSFWATWHHLAMVAVLAFVGSVIAARLCLTEAKRATGQETSG